MQKLIKMSSDGARDYFLKGESYFNNDLPSYINFEPLIKKVAEVLGNKELRGFKKLNPADSSDVNYSMISNKDGKFAWRPLELIHPAIYVSLVNLICKPSHWDEITKQMETHEKKAKAVVECCSFPLVSDNQLSDKAEQIGNWWRNHEQKSIILSLQFSHLLHTDITDCYGSLYTHSISWAIHGKKVAKQNKGEKILGNKIDYLIRAGRYGQTNGISQGSALMDFIAELVLGYVDVQITSAIKKAHIDQKAFKILRYRDDYRIFTNDDSQAGQIIKILSDCLRDVGMRLGVEKTSAESNVVAGSIKPDKLAGINLQDLGEANAKTIQKRLLRIHDFGLKFPNSGALRRLLMELFEEMGKPDQSAKKQFPEDPQVQIAILIDIATISPQTVPVVMGIISHLICLVHSTKRKTLWCQIRNKMNRVPYNGYLEIWLQRVVVNSSSLDRQSNEAICEIVNEGKAKKLWSNDWIQSDQLKRALNTSRILDQEKLRSLSKIVEPDELLLFYKHTLGYY